MSQHTTATKRKSRTGLVDKSQRQMSYKKEQETIGDDGNRGFDLYDQSLRWQTTSTRNRGTFEFDSVFEFVVAS